MTYTFTTGDEQHGFAVFSAPQPKGCWTLDGRSFFYAPFYPSWGHRLLQRLVLGIKWKRVGE